MVFRSPEEAAAPLMQAVSAASHILVTTHVNPDGDAIGSLIALGRMLRQLGKQVSLLAPSPLPQIAEVLEDTPSVLVFEPALSLPADVDLLMLVDTGNVSRIGPIATHAAEYVESRPLIVIDHHATNSGEGVLNLIMTDAASTCEMLALLAKAWNLPIDAETATALLVGSITDTQSFQTSHTSPRSLHVAAELVAAGGRLNPIVRSMLYAKPFAHAKALGLALERLHQEEHLVWTEFTQAMQHASGADDEAGDEITAYISRIGGTRACVLFKERPDGTVKISLRSSPGVDVGSLALALGGGGHREAAGATLLMPLDEARALVLERLRALVA